MKGQRVNPEKLNPMEMNSMSSMMGMMSVLQKIGKGKRKYSVKLEKNHKKFLVRFMTDIKKQFEQTYAYICKMKGVLSFFDYVKSVCENKTSAELKLSYEEFDFLKRLLTDSLKGMDAMKLKWYNLVKKATIKMMKTQYKDVLQQMKYKV